MRLLIFLLALSSAFFVSKSYSFELDMDDLISQQYKKVPDICLGPYGSSQNTIDECESIYDDAVYAITQNDRFMGGSSDGFEISETTYRVQFSYSLCNAFMDPEVGCTGLPVSKKIYNDYVSKDVGTCKDHDLHIYDVPDPTKPGNTLCAKEKIKNNCPSPNTGGPDSFTGGLGQQKTVCYNNEDGTQCKIETDENGGYYHPRKYGSQEPVQCKKPPDKEVDKTSPPEEKPAPDETDDTPQMAELDALNKINENLHAMNENQVAASDSNDERLDRVAEEIQISNELLGLINYNTAMTDSNTAESNVILRGILDNGGTDGGGTDGGGTDGGGTDGGGTDGGGTDGGGQCEGENCDNLNTDLLTRIADNTEKDAFTVNTTRKTDGAGLNSVFTESDLNDLKQEIADKKTEFTDYVEQIRTESKSLFDINPALSGGYEDRTVQIKGASVDLGIARFSDFYKLIAPAILLGATLTALFILLGAKE